MKRITSLLLALLLSASVLASCGNNDEETKDNNESNITETNAPETDAPENNATADAKGILSAVFTPFLDKMAPLFEAASGADIANRFVGLDTEPMTETDPDSGETYTYDMPVPGPSSIDVTDENELASTLFPTAHMDKLNSAAYFFNLMNQNNGTFSAFELKNASDAQAVADDLKAAINGNMWMCGFPERFLIVNVNGVVISVFGLADCTNAMKAAIEETFTDAVVLYDEEVAYEW